MRWKFILTPLAVVAVTTALNAADKHCPCNSCPCATPTTGQLRFDFQVKPANPAPVPQPAPAKPAAPTNKPDNKKHHHLRNLFKHKPQQ